MRLQSAQRARDFARLDPSTDRIDFFSEEGRREELQSSINGRFSMIDGSLVAFYRDKGVLKLRVRNKEHVIDDTVSSQLQKSEDYLNRLIAAPKRRSRKNRFSLICDGRTTVSFEYVPPPLVTFAFDPTPFVDEEDSDFMLFIHNVLNDSERRKDIWN